MLLVCCVVLWSIIMVHTAASSHILMPNTISWYRRLAAAIRPLCKSKNIIYVAAFMHSIVKVYLLLNDLLWIDWWGIKRLLFCWMKVKALKLFWSWMLRGSNEQIWKVLMINRWKLHDSHDGLLKNCLIFGSEIMLEVEELMVPYSKIKDWFT